MSDCRPFVHHIVSVIVLLSVSIVFAAATFFVTLYTCCHRRCSYALVPTAILSRMCDFLAEITVQC